ncbi:MAG TPA: lipopolysaccharide transport periplasmic protein LptA [Gallionellaceae bacterium]
MNLAKIKLSGLLCLLLLCHAASSLAERADRSKPLHLEANSVFVDDTNQLSTFDGNVQLVQGTLSIQADRIAVSQDKDGFQHCSASGHLAHFRQKREGVNEYVEAYGERIEYDTRSEIIEFFGQARIRREGDDVSGEHIVYNTRTEVFQVDGSHDQSKTAPSGGRVTVVIQPKSSAPESNAASAPPPASHSIPSTPSRLAP